MFSPSSSLIISAFTTNDKEKTDKCAFVVVNKVENEWMLGQLKKIPNLAELLKIFIKPI